MTYGDPTNPSQGRAHVPGSSGGYDDDHGPAYRGDDPLDGLSLGGLPTAGSAGRASVGRAGVGRASVSGSASVPGPGGMDAPIAGRASVPGAPVAGRATVGRAAVRSGAASEGIYDLAPPYGAGDGGAGRGPRVGTGGSAKSAVARAKRRRRRNIAIVSIAAFIMLAGVGMVSGTYYFDQVALPQDIKMAESTTIYYSDGKTPIAKIGSENRTIVTIDKIPKVVQEAVVATEDNSFYTNDGVDYKGVARAAWNNFTGGERQGASTISQQYARHWAELEGVNYARKLREAVIALKLNQQFSKDKIMEMYLNVVFFGRNAYGIEAASWAYFNKSVDKLTREEGMVLAGLIKNPAGNGKGSPFDPTIDKAQATDRFTNYIKPNMVKLKFITQAEADAMKYPENVIPAAQAKASRAQFGLDKPEGLIVHHVLDEVAKIKNVKTDKPLYQQIGDDGEPNFDTVRDGGLKIVTTIDQGAQAAAVAEGSRAAGSNMEGQPENLQAAIVAVEPGTGRVRAYYGGDNGAGNDYAGFYNDPVLTDGGDNNGGGHPPGSTFKVYALAAGLIDGYSIDSHWDATSPQEFPLSGRSKKDPAGPVKNAGDGAGGTPKCGTYCTLSESVAHSYNTPLFALTERVTPAKVVDVIRSAGVRYIWATVENKSVRKDITTGKGTDFAPNFFSTEVGIGQYPVTVLDHANGIATFAARGMASNVHFLQEIWTKDKRTHAEKLVAKRIPGFTEAMADNLSSVLQQVPKNNGHSLADGRQSAGKTGTWQYKQTTDSAHAWMVGYTASDPAKKSPGLAAAVWVGNRADEKPIMTKNGKDIYGSTLPGPIWRDFMNRALKAMKMPKATFAAPKDIGHKTEGTGKSPLPSTPPDPNPDPSGGNGGGAFPRPSRTR